jgi:predicted permease
VDLVSVINEDASPRGAVRGRFRSALVVAQVAVSLLLLVGAGLVMRSLDAARRAYPGFDPTHAATVELDLRQNGYDEAHGRAFYRRLLEAVRSDAVTKSAALATYDPLNFLDTRSRPFAIEGYDARADEDLMFLSNSITAGYFETLTIPLISGRSFEDRDDQAAAPVAMVNNTFAERFWGGAANAIGKRIRVADGEWRTVVGVAADIKYLRINESPRPYVYLPFLQDYRPTMILYTRGAGPVDTLAERARQQVATLDPDLPILGAQPLERRIMGSLILFNLAASMLFVFGVAGMTLAAMGTYGLVSYAVRQSTHEIAIRMALGASRGSVITVFLLRGLRLGGAGAVIGTVTAVFAANLLRGMLFGVSALDGISFVRAFALVLAGVAIATLVPAWRAARTDPLAALRHQ